MIKKYISQIKKNQGMTYVELIVVLSIFSVMSSIVIFNYGEFQAKVDMKNLANDVALKIVEAQKSALSGILPSVAPYITPWKPSYGLYFNLNNDNKSFIYFTDLNNNNIFDTGDCSGECLSKFSITKEHFISRIDSYTGSVATNIASFPFTIVFKRPDSSAIFGDPNGVSLSGFDYIQLTLKSPRNDSAQVKIYPSGRIQIN